MHNYATFLTSAAYPSTIVFVVGFFQWTLVLGALEEKKNINTRLLAIAGITALTLIVHQLSGVITGVMACSLAVFHPRANASAKAMAVGATVCGSLVVLGWPYFNVLDILSSTSDPRWKSADPSMDSLSTALILAAPALIGILGFRKAANGWRYEILIPALFFTLNYAALGIQGSSIAHRLIPAMILVAQLGVVWLILDYIDNASRPHNLRFAVAAAFCFVSALSAGTTGLKRLNDLEMRTYMGSLRSTAESLATLLPVHSIAFATDNIVFPLQSTGRRVVSIPRPEPVAPSLTTRQAATDLFFDDRTTNTERLKLIARWQATHAVFAATDLQPKVVAALRKLGASTKLSHTVEVVAFNLRDTGSASHGNGQ